MLPAQAQGFLINYTRSTAGDPAALGGALRQIIASLDRELAVFDALSMTERVDRSLINRRSPVVLSLTFERSPCCCRRSAFTGAGLSVVTQRTREIGIRLALGSSGRRIFDLILREGLVLIAAGFVLGAIGATALRRSLQSQLFEISATDPLTLGGAAVVLALVAVAACVLRRGARPGSILSSPWPNRAHSCFSASALGP